MSSRAKPSISHSTSPSFRRARLLQSSRRITTTSMVVWVLATSEP
jgi:hypothetical protein